jgi:hypothetical protein
MNRHLTVGGIDGSEGGRRALEWAVREADARDSAVKAVTAWSWDELEFGRCRRPIRTTRPDPGGHRGGGAGLRIAGNGTLVPPRSGPSPRDSRT